jgi:pyridoxal 5'-phosphate synthase pdxT subunit
VTIPTVGVLALQGDVREHRQSFERCGVPTREVRLAADFEQIDALAMPGGESTTMSRLLRVFGLEQPLRARLDEGLACFATCAGMILLSRRILDGRPDQLAFGALDLDVRRNGYGRQVDSFEADLEVDGFADVFHAMFIRAPWVEKVGHDVQVVATVASGDAMGRIVAVRQANLLATSFHPEITGDHRFHQLFVDQVREATG